MGHHLDAYIARPELLRGLSRLLPGARMMPLGQGLWFAPVPHELRARAMEDAGNDDAGPFLQLVAVLDHIGLELSKGGEVAWIETDWFGGIGGSRARLWRGGEVVIEEESVNTVLRAMGVRRLEEKSEIVEGSAILRGLHSVGIDLIKPRLMDEWDSVGLGVYRNTESCFERAKPME